MIIASVYSRRVDFDLLFCNFDTIIAEKKLLLSLLLPIKLLESKRKFKRHFNNQKLLKSLKTHQISNS